MLIEKESMFTGVRHKMDIPVTLEQWADWRTGTLIQDAMPHLSRQHREFLISGVTPEEWAQHMEDEEPVLYTGHNSK